MKQQKGITLIALVITIIVLLILAGVTIAMLTGTDAAPVKANEAKQKQDIGAAKDQVMLYAQEFQTLAYEKIYVRGEGVSNTTQAQTSTTKSGNIGTLVGSGIVLTKNQGTSDVLNVFAAGSSSNKVTSTSISKGLGGMTVGLATIDTQSDAFGTTEIAPGAQDVTAGSAHIRISTTDFVTYGYITSQGGILVWDKDIQARTK